MAYPADLGTENVNDIFVATKRALENTLTNLITNGNDGIFPLCARFGRLLPLQGGDEHRTTVIVDGGQASVVVNPNTADPTTSLGTTASQRTALARWPVFERTKSIYFYQGIPILNSGPGAIADAIGNIMVADAMQLIDDAQGSDTATDGFFAAEAITWGNTFSNADAMFVDQAQDVGGVDVSTYTQFQPTVTNNATHGVTANGTEILGDLTLATRRQTYAGEGGPNLCVTTDDVFNKVQEEKILNGAPSADPALVDFGVGDATKHGPLTVVPSKNLAAATFWDQGAVDSVHPIFLIDMNNFGCRIVRGGSGTPGDPHSLIHKMGDVHMHDNLAKSYQRVSMFYSFYFERSRRTSGYMDDITLA